MVTLASNTIRVQVGFAISYQWAIDAHNAVKRGIRTGKTAVCTRYATTRQATLKTADNAKTMTINTAVCTTRTIQAAPAIARDRIAALMLGMHVDQLATLRQLAVNPQFPALAKSSAKATPKPATLAVPQTGACVDAKELLAALARVKPAVATKGSLPILQHILITPNVDTLRLTATDLEFEIQTTVRAAVSTLSALTVPCVQLIKALTGAKGSITLDHDGTHAILTIGSRTVKLESLPADEFPVSPVVEGITHDVPQLISAIAGTIQASSEDESRMSLCGILFTSDRLVATDTHRLFIARHGGKLGKSSGIVPNSVCVQLAKCLGLKTDAVIRVCIDSKHNKARFTYQDTTIISRLIEGTFPNFEKVIPAEFNGSISLDTAALTEALNGLSVTAMDDSYRVVCTILDNSDGSHAIKLSACSLGNTSEATIPIGIDGTLDGGDDMPFQTAFRLPYMLDSIKACSSPRVTISLLGTLSPAMIQGNDSQFSILMPMQVKG